MEPRARRDGSVGLWLEILLERRGALGPYVGAWIGYEVVGPWALDMEFPGIPGMSLGSLFESAMALCVVHWRHVDADNSRDAAL